MQKIINKHHSNEVGFSRHYLTLYAIILGMEAKEVFEFGAGFSSYVILEALKKTGGKLTSCEIRDKNKIGVEIDNPEWNFIQSDSRNTDLKGNYDVVLHDGSHTPDIVTDDLNRIIPYMKQGSLLLIHDTEHHYKLDKVVEKINYPQVTLPFGYGLTIIRITEGKDKIDLKWTKNTKVI